MAPAKHALMSMNDMRTASNLLNLNNLRLRTGVAHLRSRRTNSTRHIANSNNAGAVRPVTPAEGNDSTTYSPDANIANSKAAPSMSNEVFSNPLSAGMALRASATAARPIGTLMRNIQCQDASWVRIPPTAGPSAPPTAAPSMTIARANPSLFEE